MVLVFILVGCRGKRFYFTFAENAYFVGRFIQLLFAGTRKGKAFFIERHAVFKRQ